MKEMKSKLWALVIPKVPIKAGAIEYFIVPIQIRNMYIIRKEKAHTQKTGLLKLSSCTIIVHVCLYRQMKGQHSYECAHPVADINSEKFKQMDTRQTTSCEG